ncbi:P-loop NTPase fold protein [Pseudoalteromonas sp. NSLLW218]|uniref:KAP family P-loop NTPase fold protein n=1 Tax=Pseudoalteromonas sp. NSLLW218 TaxID=2792048 RepID=UPI0018CD87C0|nr:P-loop NTPase fold protein [Pseudoalteromonas sp. NSLLW218]MBH0090307.1 hypothetical protein [Pseudoalteromonas sp. NSLLW218]
MDFDWSNIKVIDGEQFSSDNLDRAKYATYLTSLIKAKGGTDKNNLSNYVLNLDAEWGAGKTYFLKRWSEDLKSNHPVVYIDTWAIDYLESPLMTVLSEIIEQLKSQTDRADTPKAKAKFKEIIKAAAPRVGSGLMKRYLGFDLDVFDSSQTDGANLSNKEIDFSKAGEKVLEIFCKEVTDSKKSVKALKLAIQDWVEYVVDHPVKNMNTITNSYPAFIFIDELDRCKPTYAVEMLEAIKHVFDIPGLVFIVATNTMQLSHTVKAVYGSKFDAEIYLSRFFDNKYYLRSKVSEELLLNHHSKVTYDLKNLVERGIILFPYINFNSKDFLKLCSDVFNEFKIPPRQSIKVLNRIQLVVSTMRGNTTLDMPLLLCLCTFMEMGQNKLESAIRLFKTAVSSEESMIYHALGAIKFDFSISSFENRKIYDHISDQELIYESSNNGAPAKRNSINQELTLNDYLLNYKRQTTLYGYSGIGYHNEIQKLIETNRRSSSQSNNRSLIDKLKTKRIHLMFYIFNNDSNFDYYQELVEMSANLD